MTKSLPDNRVVIVVAFENYQDLELQGVKEALVAARAQVTIASSSLGTARGKLGGEIKIDQLLGEVKIADYDGVVFIGGPGAAEYLNNPDAHHLAQAAKESNKVLGAICMAPEILARAGVLKGKKATVWTSGDDQAGIKLLQASQAEYLDQPVVVDGQVVTADGPAAAADFGQALVELLASN